jgi:hypothetical protein
VTEAGAPLDFMLNNQPSLTQPQEVMQDSQYRSQWAALLISMHMNFLYEHLRGESPEFAAFLDEQLDCQKQWRKMLKVSKKESDAAYALFQWCDRLSLILCRRELPEAERALEVSPGPDGTRYEVLCHDDVVKVQPWPFEETRFTVSVEAMNLEQMRFQNDQALRRALQAAPLVELTWELAQ